MEVRRKAVARWEVILLDKILRRDVKNLEIVIPDDMLQAFNEIFERVKTFDLDDPEARIDAYYVLRELSKGIRLCCS